MRLMSAINARARTTGSIDGAVGLVTYGSHSPGGSYSVRLVLIVIFWITHLAHRRTQRRATSNGGKPWCPSYSIRTCNGQDHIRSIRQVCEQCSHRDLFDYWRSGYLSSLLQLCEHS